VSNKDSENKKWHRKTSIDVVTPQKETFNKILSQNYSPYMSIKNTGCILKVKIEDSGSSGVLSAHEVSQWFPDPQRAPIPSRLQSSPQ
jgi:hypothetical protein